MLTYEEARERVDRCNRHIVPTKQDDGTMVCSSCLITLIPDGTNKVGYRHYHPPDDEKMCKACFVSRPIEEFHKRVDMLDGRRNVCVHCTYKQRHSNAAKLGKKRVVRIPDDLWNAIEKVKGKQDISRFVQQACRAEVERRVSVIMTQQALAGIKRDQQNR